MSEYEEIQGESLGCTKTFSAYIHSEQEISGDPTSILRLAEAEVFLAPVLSAY